MIELTADERAAFEAVDEIQGIKRDNKQAPDYAQLHEVYNFLRPEMADGFEPRILEALRSLCRRGLLCHNLNVNKLPMFGVKE